MRPGPLDWDQSVGFYAGFRFGVRKDSTPLRGTREVSPAAGVRGFQPNGVDDE